MQRGCSKSTRRLSPGYWRDQVEEGGQHFPALFLATPKAQKRFWKFFTANIRNAYIEQFGGDLAAPSVKLRKQGEALLAGGQIDRALAAAEEALADDPLDGGARLLRAKILARRGHFEAARTDLALVSTLAPDRAVEAEAESRAIEGR